MRITLVGAPNVGKSALFNRLTGRYVTVSNYPGTSVEVTRGTASLGPAIADVLDTPGIYSLLPSSDDERVTRRVLLDVGSDVVVHVVDAKNLPRMLSLTLQLLELGRPVVVALNMIDEADRLGLRISAAALAQRLGVCVIPVVAVRGQGMDALRSAIARAAETPVPLPPVYGNGVGTALRTLRGVLTGVYPVDPAAFVALALPDDPEAGRSSGAPSETAAIRRWRRRASWRADFDAPASYRIAVERQRAAEGLLERVVTAPASHERLPDRICRDCG